VALNFVKLFSPVVSDDVFGRETAGEAKWVGATFVSVIASGGSRHLPWKSELSNTNIIYGNTKHQAQVTTKRERRPCVGFEKVNLLELSVRVPLLFRHSTCAKDQHQPLAPHHTSPLPNREKPSGQWSQLAKCLRKPSVHWSEQSRNLEALATRLWVLSLTGVSRKVDAFGTAILVGTDTLAHV
jgi:hypothetical protein